MACRLQHPPAPTACPGWLAHDVLAHAVAGGAEIGRLVGNRLAGERDGPTIAFETREPPFRALPYDQLVDLVAAGGLGALFEAWAEGGLATVTFTGWQMDVATMAAHAVRSLGSFGVIDERATLRTERMLARGHASLGVRLRSADVADVHIRADVMGTVVELVEPAGDAAVELDAGSRLLALWGRRPGGPRSLDCEPALASWLWP